MKHTFLILCMAFALSAHVGAQGYVINGTISGADGKTVSLRQYRDLKPVEVSSATVQAGKFTLNGNAPIPDFCLLYVDEWGPMQFFVENANIQVFVDMVNPEKSTVTGSKETDIFMEFVNELENFAQRQKQLTDSYTTMSTSSVASPEALTNIRLQVERLNAERIAYATSFVQKYPGKIVTAFIVVTSLMQVFDMTQLEQVANGFDAQTAQSPWVNMLKEHVESVNRTAIGKPFLDITLKTPDEQPISISDFAGKGKYVLLDFWAAWCGPCRVANPRIVELYNRYKDKGFEIIGISLDQSKEAWVKAIGDDNLTWPQMSDLKHWQSDAAKLYSVSAIPYTVLLDREGKIIAKGLHVGTLTTKLAEIFDN